METKKILSKITKFEVHFAMHLTLKIEVFLPPLYFRDNHQDNSFRHQLNAKKDEFEQSELNRNEFADQN